MSGWATGRTVLVVDDDPNVTMTFARLLRLEGYEVLTACDGDSALSELVISRPDAILLDLHMPIVHGLTFLRRLRSLECGRRTPVAVVTGDYGVDETMERELNDLDAFLYLKPLWHEELVAIMQRLLGDV